MIGIYKIENKETGLIYIGQSIDIHRRWKDHRGSAFNSNSKDYSIPLYRDMRQYGLQNFNFEVVEECKKEELNNREQYWIEYYDSFYAGYNESFGGTLHCRHSNISKEKIIGVISDLKNTNYTHKKIANKWNLSEEMVQGINTGRYWKHNISYLIQNKDGGVYNKKIYIYKCKICNKDFKTYDKNQIYCSQDCYHKASRKVERPSKEYLFELIKYTPFTKIGEMYGVSDNAVRRWCRNYNIPYRQEDIKALMN